MFGQSRGDGNRCHGTLVGMQNKCRRIYCNAAIAVLPVTKRICRRFFETPPHRGKGLGRGNFRYSSVMCSSCDGKNLSGTGGMVTNLCPRAALCVTVTVRRSVSAAERQSGLIAIIATQCRHGN